MAEVDFENHINHGMSDETVVELESNSTQF